MARGNLQSVDQLGMDEQVIDDADVEAALDRVMGHVVPLVGGCWQWTAATDRGYGKTYIGGGRTGPAHRFVYELLIGAVPMGLDLDHLCRNRACVNQTHLEPVTRRINLLRGIGFTARRAAQVSCVHGHPFDAANTIRRRDGTRDCRSCRNRRNSARNRVRTSFDTKASSRLRISLLGED